MHLQATMVRLAIAAVTCLGALGVLVPAAEAGTSSDAMTLAPQSQITPTQTSSSEVMSGPAAGDYKTTWQGAGFTDQAVAPAGSQINFTTIGGQPAVEIVPPQLVGALDGLSASAAVTPDSTPAPPPNHQNFNQLYNTYCYNLEALYSSSWEYSIQETPGDVLMGDGITSSGWGGSCSGPIQNAKASYFAAYNEWPNSSGDSPAQDYHPTGTYTDVPNPENITVGMTFGGFSLSDSFVLGTSDTFGPYFPHTTNQPAFGSQWSGCTTGSTNDIVGLASGAYTKIGAGQSDWNVLVQVVNYNGC